MRSPKNRLRRLREWLRRHTWKRKSTEDSTNHSNNGIAGVELQIWRERRQSANEQAIAEEEEVLQAMMRENEAAASWALIREDEEDEEEALRAPIREEGRLTSERRVRYADNAGVPRHLVTRRPLREIESIGRWDENGDYHEDVFNLDERDGEGEPSETIQLHVDWIGDHPTGDLGTRIVVDALEMTAQELENQAPADRFPARTSSRPSP